MNPYDYSKPINLWLTSDSVAYQRLILDVTNGIERELKANHGLTRFKFTDHKIALHHILADLIITYKSDSKRYLAFSRDKQWFSTKTRYQPKRFAFKPFVNTIVALDSLGYIESTKGFQDLRTGMKRLSRMIATSKLIKLFDDRKLNIDNFYQLDTKESIILKSPKDSDGNKALLDYSNTAKTKTMRDNVKLINENISKHWIDLKVTDEQFKALQDKLYKRATSNNKSYNRKAPVDFNRTNLVRIFNNGSFEDGGRFYRGWWQEILSDYRQYITIDGKETVEVDYSAMHFYMMYAEQGLSIPVDDPYTFDGLERKDVKIALNIAINAGTEKNGISAINSNVWPQKARAEVKAVLEVIKEKHKAISMYFFSGKGVRLQYLDSKIAELVMLNLMKFQPIVALPVHDSFIVAKENKPYLVKQMKECFKLIVASEAKVKASDEVDYDKIIKSLESIDWTNVGKLTTSEAAITNEAIQAGAERLALAMAPLVGYEKRREQWEDAHT